MIKKNKNHYQQEIGGLASQCEELEQQVHNSITEILKLVESINIDLEEELNLEENNKNSVKVEYEKQVEIS